MYKRFVTQRGKCRTPPFKGSTHKNVDLTVTGDAPSSDEARKKISPELNERSTGPFRPFIHRRSLPLCLLQPESSNTFPRVFKR